MNECHTLKQEMELLNNRKPVVEDSLVSCGDSFVVQQNNLQPNQTYLKISNADTGLSFAEVEQEPKKSQRQPIEIHSGLDTTENPEKEFMKLAEERIPSEFPDSSFFGPATPRGSLCPSNLSRMSAPFHHSSMFDQSNTFNGNLLYD